MRLGLMMTTAIAAIALAAIGVQASPLLGGGGLVASVETIVSETGVALCEATATESYCKSIDESDDDDEDDGDAMEMLLGGDDDDE